MFSRPKSWLPSLLTKPKNPHSLEHLKYLYSILLKNQIVGEHNRSLLVETLRSISEILIWGDQNDSSVFDFFLEKSMLAFFLRYLRQKSGRYICVQLLQTLNIMFDNINNETSLYYLLSNNHINSIIVHKFDFSDEEVMAYYISFLKTLSLKLNRHTIHFFYNEHTNDFALYTEAIKFFNHSETMVRIAVRTITLNVFRVEDKAMLRYVRDRTAAPYFSNLVWFIGNHILDLDICVRNDANHQNRDRLADLVAEHLDHLHYLNDILCINTDALNDVLTDHLLNKLFIPLYVYSLTRRKRYTGNEVDKKHVSSVVSLFLLSQVFLILNFAPLVRQLAEIIFQGEISLTRDDTREDSPKMRVLEFAAPEESLVRTLEKGQESTSTSKPEGVPKPSIEPSAAEGGSTEAVTADDGSSPSTEGSEQYPSELSSPTQNSTDEEKLMNYGQRIGHGPSQVPERHSSFSLENRPYLEAIFNTLECSENDYEALFSLCLLFAIGHNKGIHQGLLDTILMTTDKSENKDYYNVALVERLIKIITLACQTGSKVRLSTLELAMKLLQLLVCRPNQSFLQDRHLACIENARECSTQVLRNFYKSEEIFLDMFEDEYREMKNCPLNVEYLTMDASILLPPTVTPLTGIDFNKRLPCGEVERARRAIRVFLLVRDLSLTLMHEKETQLPLTKEENTVTIKDILDLNNSDLIACTILSKESRKQERRFLVIDTLQMILVEPDMKKLGWGIVRFVGSLQDVEVTGDKEDSRSLHITIHKPASSQHVRPTPLLSARFVFDDHIRCMAAKQRLSKGRSKARQQKMHMIERLLDIPADGSYGHTGPYPGQYGRPAPVRSHPGRAVSSINQTKRSQTGEQRLSQPVHPTPQSRSKIHSRGGTPTKHLGRNTVSGDVPKPSNCDDIEIAEEASAFAFQSLNQHVVSSSETRRLSGPDTGTQVQEIPLEDLSKKSKKRTIMKYSQSHLTDIHSRSHSHSPKRTQTSDLAKSKRGRSISVTTPPSFTRDRSTTPVRTIRSKSSPIPMASSPSLSHSDSNSSSENSPALLRSRLGKDISGQSPKSLQPALAPTLTLLPQNNGHDIMKKGSADSPKLIPPAEVDRIRNVSESSVGKSEDNSIKAGTLETKTQQIDQSPVKAQPGMATADELTKLAQMVQEHYKFSDSSSGTDTGANSEGKE